MIEPALKSNSKKIKNSGLQINFQILNADMSIHKTNSSIPPKTKLKKTYKTKDVINKMLANTSLETNSNILPTISNRKRTPNRDLKLNPKKIKEMLLEQDQNPQPMKIKNGVTDEIKHMKTIIITSETLKKIKTDGLQLMSTGIIEKNRKIAQKINLRVSPKPKKTKNNKGKRVQSDTENMEQNSITSQVNDVEMSTEPKKTKNNKNRSPQPMNTKNTEKNGIASKINNVEMSPEPKMPKVTKKSLRLMNVKSIEKIGIAGQINGFEMAPEPKKAINIKNKLLQSINVKGIEKNSIACKKEDLKISQKSKKPIKEKKVLEPMNVERNGIADVKMSPEPKKANSKKKLQSINAKSIEENGIAGRIKDSVNLKKPKRNKVEYLTADQLKDSINLQISRINEMERNGYLEPVITEGIPGQIQDSVNLEKLRNNETKNHIADEKKYLKNLKARLWHRIKKDKVSQVYITGPRVEDRLNSYVEKKLGLATDTIVSVNAYIGLLVNISAWSELLADLPEEGRVMVFESPSLLVPFLSECEPLLPLRQVIKDLGLVLQKQQEIEELEEAASVPMAELEETDNSEDDEEKKSQKKKQIGFRKNNKDEGSSNSSWQGYSSEESLFSDEDSSDEYGVEKKVKIIKKKLNLCEIMNLKDKVCVTDNPSCLRSDNYFNKPVGKFLIGIGSNLAHEYFQRDLLREQKLRLHKLKELQKSYHALKRSLSFSRKNLKIAAEANLGFKFKQKKCEFCSFQSESMLAMDLHMNSPHNIEDDKFQCNYCDIELNGSSVTLEHMATVHGIAGHVEAPLPKFPCPLCPLDFKVALSLHTKLCLQKFNIHRNLIPEFCDLPAKVMPEKSIKCPDQFVEDIRTFLTHKTTMEFGDCVGQTTMDNLKVAPAVAACKHITNSTHGLDTPSFTLKVFLKQTL